MYGFMMKKGCVNKRTFGLEKLCDNYKFTNRFHINVISNAKIFQPREQSRFQMIGIQIIEAQL